MDDYLLPSIVSVSSDRFIVLGDNLSIMPDGSARARSGEPSDGIVIVGRLTPAELADALKECA